MDAFRQAANMIANESDWERQCITIMTHSLSVCISLCYVDYLFMWKNPSETRPPGVHTGRLLGSDYCKDDDDNVLGGCCTLYRTYCRRDDGTMEIIEELLASSTNSNCEGIAETNHCADFGGGKSYIEMLLELINDPDNAPGGHSSSQRIIGIASPIIQLPCNSYCR